ncbi:MAG TPA: VWA domain-containing protein [Flavobacterium sp.]|jgi:Ca-activated chloride channel family protein
MELDEKKYLYLLLLLPILGCIFLYNLYWKRNKQREFGDPELVAKLSPERSLFKQTLKMAVLLLAFAFLAMALVNPKIGTKAETVKREGIDIVFAVDVSKSMLCEDVAPSRLEKSKQVVSQLINQLAGDRIGIVAYAGSAFPVLPITSDYNVAKMFLQSMNPGMVSSQGTSLDDAINLSATYFGDDKQSNKMIILISDGEDHSEGAEDAAEEAKKLGIKIITVGIGTEKGGPIPLKRNGTIESFQRDQDNQVVVTKLNTESLKTIAKNSKGYVNGNSTKEVVDYVKSALDTIEKTEFETQQFTDYNSQFQWFLAIAFVLLAIDVLLLEKKTEWVRRLNLFNEKGK